MNPEIAEVLEGKRRWAVVHSKLEAVLPSLPDLSVAHLVADPPYSEHTHAKVRRGGSVHAPDRREGVKRPVISTSVVLGFDALTPELRALVSREAARLVKRWVLAFSDAESVHSWADDLKAAGLEHVRTGAWVKVGATPQFTGDRPGIGFEAIEIAHRKGRKRWNGGGQHGLWTFPICSEGRLHPTQKPLPLMIELVRQFTEPGDVVLDPFCGSGTTGEACLLTGRKFIGIEMNEQHANSARARLAATEPDDFLSQSTKKAKQSSLLSMLGGQP